MGSRPGDDDGNYKFLILLIFYITSKDILRMFTIFLDISTESVEVLRERLNTMKRLMAERQNGINSRSSPSIDDILFNRTATKHPGIIDGNFLSFALCGALLTIIVVATYAFYSLYNAVLKKFPSHHTEL